MNVAGAPVITFRRIGTRNSGRGTLHYFRRRCAHTRVRIGEILLFLFFSFFLSFFCPPSCGTGGKEGGGLARRNSNGRERREEREERGKDGRLAINPFNCETFESKSKFRFGGAAALSTGSAASASYLWTLSCPRNI